MFPKASSYDGKNLDTQRIYLSVFKKYLGILKDAGCQVEYFLEDKLAMDFIKQFNFDSSRVLTCVSPSDITFFNNYRELIDLEPYVYEEYNDAIKEHGNYEKKKTVPITLLRSDREAYIQKRTDVYRWRTRSALDSYLSKSKASLMFRFDNGSDRASALRETVSQGDGRICIEVNPDSGAVLTYYGGTYLTEDNIPIILSL